MAKTIIPSTTVKSQYLQRNLKLNSIFIDPCNGFKYKVEEREQNGTISKVATYYSGSEDGLEIDVPEKYRKLQNVKRCTPLHSMRLKIDQLETLNKQLMSKIVVGQTSYEQIQELLGHDILYCETDDGHYLLNWGVVFQLPKSKLKQGEDCMVVFKEMSDKVSKDPERMEKLMKRQPRIQNKLLEYLEKKSKQEEKYI